MAFSSKTLKGLLSMVFATATLVACGAQNNNGGVVTAGPGVGQTGVNVDIRTCQIGQIYTPQHGCLNRGHCQQNAGNVVGTNQCVTGQVVTEEIIHGTFASTRLYSSITITNQVQLELLLKNANLCNFGAFGWGATFGTANCSYLASRGAFVVLRAFPGSTNNVSLMIGAGSNYPQDMIQFPGMYSQQFMNGYQMGYPQMGWGNVSQFQRYSFFSQQARAYEYNNNNGMQIVGLNYNGGDVGLRLIIDNGHLGSQTLNGRLVYQSVDVGTVQLQRY